MPPTIAEAKRRTGRPLTAIQAAGHSTSLLPNDIRPPALGAYRCELSGAQWLLKIALVNLSIDSPTCAGAGSWASQK